MKSICLKAEEVHSLQSGPVTLYRPIKHKEFQPSQTPGYDWTFRYRSCWNDFTTENLLASKKHAPYKVGMELIVREAFWAQHDTDCDDYTTWDCGPSLDNPGMRYELVANPTCLDTDFSDHKAVSTKVARPTKVEPGDWWLSPPPKYNGYDDYFDDPDAVWEFQPWQYYTKFGAGSMPLWMSRMKFVIDSVGIVNRDGVWSWEIQGHKV